MSLVKSLTDRGLIAPPHFLPMNVHYETWMGSTAYGVDSDSSDIDVYGFCIPPKEVIFPHLSGEIYGFGRQIQRFEQYQKHHILDKDALAGKGREYDISIYNIVKYFQLCMENNPNMIDSLFTPVSCLTCNTKVGQMVRENRKMFLHKGSWHKFKGYAYSQMHKMKSKSPEAGSKRAALVEKHGYDTKFAYHVVRLLNEVEQILIEGDIDLQRNREQLKSIKRGEWKEEEVVEYFTRKEKELESLYVTSPLQYKPDEGKIKALLLQCLEEHYGNLDSCISEPEVAVKTIEEIKILLQRYENAKMQQTQVLQGSAKTEGEV